MEFGGALQRLAGACGRNHECPKRIHYSFLHTNRCLSLMGPLIMKSRALCKAFVGLAFRLMICALVVPCVAGAAEFTPRVVNNNETVVLKGNVHPLARPEFDVGLTASSLPMDRMILSLRLTPNKQAELERLLADQQDPASPSFHHWLTPEEFGANFGPQHEDIAAITSCLTSQGF